MTSRSSTRGKSSVREVVHKKHKRTKGTKTLKEVKALNSPMRELGVLISKMSLCLLSFCAFCVLHHLMDNARSLLSSIPNAGAPSVQICARGWSCRAHNIDYRSAGGS